jgi:hypothetical protein
MSNVLYGSKQRITILNLLLYNKKLFKKNMTMKFFSSQKKPITNISCNRLSRFLIL